MIRYFRITAGILLSLGLLFVPPETAQAQSAAGPLRIGDPLPDVIGQSLAGNSTHLATEIAGRIAVVVFSFSKAGGKDTQLWDRALLQDFGSNRSVALSTVIMLQSAPRLLRGIIVSGITNNMPDQLHGSTIVSYVDEKLWKQRLAVANDSHAYVMLLGQDGRIRWRNSDAFSNAEYKELKSNLQKLSQSANLGAALHHIPLENL